MKQLLGLLIQTNATESRRLYPRFISCEYLTMQMQNVTINRNITTTKKDLDDFVLSNHADM